MRQKSLHHEQILEFKLGVECQCGSLSETCNVDLWAWEVFSIRTVSQWIIKIHSFPTSLDKEVCIQHIMLSKSKWQKKVLENGYDGNFCNPTKAGRQLGM